MHVEANLNIDLLATDVDEEVTCLVQLTAPTIEADAARPGQTLVIVLDRSGSMGGAPISNAKQAIGKLVRRLAPQDAFGLIVFDNEADIVAPVHRMADHHMPTLQHAIASISERGNTDLSAGYLIGLREAKRSLAETGHRGATILIISDGEANAGVLDPVKLDSLALSAFHEDRITTSTLGLGQHYNELQLAALTHGGNGEHRFAPDIDTAVAMLSELVSDLLDKSVLGVSLRIKRQPALVSQVLLRSEIPAFVDGEAVVVPLGDLYANEERGVLVKFVVPGLSTLGTTSIADIVLEYASMPDLKEHTVTLPIAVNVVPGDEARGRVPNPTVEVASLLADLADDKKAVGDELRSGDVQAAQRRLSSGLSRLDATRAEMDAKGDVDADLALRLEEARREIAQLTLDVTEQDVQYSSKMVMQAYNAQSRGRSRRPRPNSTPAAD